jgi:undecaprenyl pyrophosphate phosphatase UppP
MKTAFSDILLGVKRSIGLLSRRDKLRLGAATFIMLITGILANGPAVILGLMVDQLVGSNVIQFDVAVPFMILLSVVILVREGLTVARKYLIEDIATQTDKRQTVEVIDR